MSEADIGLIGLAVMGQNLALNMSDHGFKVAVYNRTQDKVDDFLAGKASGRDIQGAHSIAALVATLSPPRRVMMMVKAGQAVDDLIDQLLPHLQPGDILLDGGNELFTHTNRRTEALARQGILYVGTGISGGEAGARHGPSIMPGGNPDAWPGVKGILQAIAARVDNQPCCEWIGAGGAGHYVKMVHNGIEYGDMQLICEAYDFMQRGLGLDQDQMAAIFARWNTGLLDSYLVEITANILAFKDAEGPTLARILDRAGQKGTGKSTAVNALDLGIHTPAFAAALAYYDGYRSARLPANLLQAQRDYFGAHTYERIDRPRGEMYHTQWLSGT